MSVNHCYEHVVFNPQCKACSSLLHQQNTEWKEADAVPIRTPFDSLFEALDLPNTTFETVVADEVLIDSTPDSTPDTSSSDNSNFDSGFGGDSGGGGASGDY